MKGRVLEKENYKHKFISNYFKEITFKLDKNLYPYNDIV